MCIRDSASLAQRPEPARSPSVLRLASLAQGPGTGAGRGGSVAAGQAPGVLVGGVAVDDLVFVTFIDSPTLECELRAGSVDTQLHGYDSDTLERVVARVLPSCADRIVPDGRGGFVLTFFEDGAWKLGRFDRTGARLVTRTLSVPGPGMPESSIVDDLAVVADPPRIAVLFGPTFEGTAPPTINLDNPAVVPTAASLSRSSPIPILSEQDQQDIARIWARFAK